MGREVVKKVDPKIAREGVKRDLKVLREGEK